MEKKRATMHKLKKRRLQYDEGEMDGMDRGDEMDEREEWNGIE